MSTDHPNRRAAITTNPHDHGLDVVAGADITGRVIASIYMQAPGSPDADEHGLVLTIVGDDEAYLPDTAQDVARVLQEQTGRELSGESLADVEALRRPRRAGVMGAHERIHRDQDPVKTADELTVAERLALADLREALADAKISADDLPETTDPGAQYRAYACEGERCAYAFVDGVVITISETLAATGDLDGQTA